MASARTAEAMMSRVITRRRLTAVGLFQILAAGRATPAREQSLSSEALARVTLFAGFILSAAAHAERLPVLPQIDLPHPYYFREMYLPQLTSGPSSLAWSAGFPGADLFHGRFAVAPDARLTESRNSSRAASLRLSAGLVAGRPLGHLQLVSRRCGGIVDSRLDRVARRRPLTGERRRQRRAAILARRQAHRVRLDAVQQALSYFHGGLQRRQARSHLQRLTGENKSDAAALLLQRLSIMRSIRCGAATGGRSSIVSNRNHLYGTGGFWRTPSRARRAARRSRPAAAATRISLRRDQLEGAAGCVARRLAPGVQLLPGALLAQPVGDAGAAAAMHFRSRYGDWDQTNPRWSPDGTPRRLHLEPERQHGNRMSSAFPGGVASRSRSPSGATCSPMARLHLDIKDSKGGPASARVSITDAAGRFLCPGRCLDQRGRWRSIATNGTFEAHYFHAHGEEWVDVPRRSRERGCHARLRAPIRAAPCPDRRRGRPPSCM